MRKPILFLYAFAAMAVIGSGVARADQPSGVFAWVASLYGWILDGVICGLWAWFCDLFTQFADWLLPTVVATNPDEPQMNRSWAGQVGNVFTVVNSYFPLVELFAVLGIVQTAMTSKVIAAWIMKLKK